MQAAIKAIANQNLSALYECREDVKRESRTEHYINVLVPICFIFHDCEAARSVIYWEDNRETRAEMVRELFENHNEMVQDLLFFSMLLSVVTTHFSDTVIASAIETNNTELVQLALQTLHKDHESNEMNFKKIARVLKGKDDAIITKVLNCLYEMPRNENIPYQTICYFKEANSIEVSLIEKVVKIVTLETSTF
ncbi:Hypothetical protein POVR1_LOCUS98 [uncultured virus]|nr:Hypothetical protein POVR1_LOCUS98 [uncultured virus]